MSPTRLWLEPSRPTDSRSKRHWPPTARRIPTPAPAICSPQYNGLLGACHALEIPFVFDTLGAGTKPLLGPNPPQKLADAMHASWVGFATNGDSGWPRYELDRMATMRFDTTPEVVYDPQSATRALWEGAR